MPALYGSDGCLRRCIVLGAVFGLSVVFHLLCYCPLCYLYVFYLLAACMLSAGIMYPRLKKSSVAVVLPFFLLLRQLRVALFRWSLSPAMSCSFATSASFLAILCDSIHST